MSANANGTPTSLGIPTLAVTDPLTKDGINEITSSVDSKISARMFAPTAPSDKQVAKWSLSGGTWVAGNVQPSEIGQEGATSGQALVWSVSQGKWIPVTKATHHSTPADPASTVSTTLVMAGLAGSITPAGSGIVVFKIQGGCTNTAAAGNSISTALNTGTGGAPANGAAGTGTQRTATIGVSPSAASFWLPFCHMAVVTGLAIGTAVWYDASFATQSGTGSLRQITMDAWEL